MKQYLLLILFFLSMALYAKTDFTKYNDGKSAYKNRDYEKALQLFEDFMHQNTNEHYPPDLSSIINDCKKKSEKITSKSKSPKDAISSKSDSVITRDKKENDTYTVKFSDDDSKIQLNRDSLKIGSADNLLEFIKTLPRNDTISGDNLLIITVSYSNSTLTLYAEESKFTKAKRIDINSSPEQIKQEIEKFVMGIDKKNDCGEIIDKSFVEDYIRIFDLSFDISKDTTDIDKVEQMRKFYRDVIFTERNVGDPCIRDFLKKKCSNHRIQFIIIRIICSISEFKKSQDFDKKYLADGIIHLYVLLKNEDNKDIEKYNREIKKWTKIKETLKY